MHRFIIQFFLAISIAMLPMTQIMASVDVAQLEMSDWMQNCDGCMQSQMNMDCSKGQCGTLNCISAFSTPLCACYATSSLKIINSVIQPLALMRSFYNSPPSRSLFRPPIV